MTLDECYKGGGVRVRQSLPCTVVWRGVGGCFRQTVPLNGTSRGSLGLGAAAEWERFHKSSKAVVKEKMVIRCRCAYTVQ